MLLITQNWKIAPKMVDFHKTHKFKANSHFSQPITNISLVLNIYIDIVGF